MGEFYIKLCQSKRFAIKNFDKVNCVSYAGISPLYKNEIVSLFTFSTISEKR